MSLSDMSLTSSRESDSWKLASIRGFFAPWMVSDVITGRC